MLFTILFSACRRIYIKNMKVWREIVNQEKSKQVVGCRDAYLSLQIKEAWANRERKGVCYIPGFLIYVSINTQAITCISISTFDNNDASLVLTMNRTSQGRRINRSGVVVCATCKTRFWRSRYIGIWYVLQLAYQVVHVNESVRIF